MIAIIVFIFGTICGSAINAIDYRLGAAKSWIHGRSACPHCGHVLSWWELVPIISFLFLGTRCSQCERRISWQYPLVELAAGLLLLLAYQTFLPALAIFSGIIFLLLLLIYVHDARTLIIPNYLVWSFNVLAFLSAVVNVYLDGFLFWPSVYGWILAGPILALPLFGLWYFSHGRALGFGDVKLALGIGWLLGLFAGASAIVLAFWIGAGVSLLFLAVQHLWKNSSRSGGKKLTMKSAVPFGPFMILGFLLVFIADLNVLSLF